MLPWRMRVAKPGEGRRLKPLWKPWLGIAYDEAMDSLDDGLLIDGYEVLELVLYAEDRATGQVAGMLFAGPGSKLLLAVPEELRPDLAQLVTKLVAVAVDPGARGRGLGRLLVKRAIAEYRARDYVWMYGQFAASQRVDGFYRRLGFTVHPRGVPLPLPAKLGGALAIDSQPDEHWFDQLL